MEWNCNRRTNWIQGHGAPSLRPTGSRLRRPALSLSRWTARVTWVRGFSPREDTPIGGTRRGKKREGAREREREREGSRRRRRWRRRWRRSWRTRVDSWRQRRRPSTLRSPPCLFINDEIVQGCASDARFLRCSRILDPPRSLSNRGG